MKYRKKPLVIEAFQWHGEEVQGLTRQHITQVDPTQELKVVYQLNIPTLEGMMCASEGDYIITGIAGERYPCKENIFLATYEPVAEEAK